MVSARGRPALRAIGDSTAILSPALVRERRTDRRAAVLLFAGLLSIYNANGREIPSYDSQPTKLAARELLLRGTLRLDRVVAATPEYATRWGFIRATDGSYRSVYSPVPSLVAAAVAWPLWKVGLVDIRAPRAPNLIAKLTASTLIAGAVVLSFFTARRTLPRHRALLVAGAVGLGTGLWSTASQTLWQTETAVFGLAMALLPFGARREDLSAWSPIVIGLGLGIALTARLQLAPAVACLLVGTWMTKGARAALVSTAVVAALIVPLAFAYSRWFGNPLGALPLTQEVNSRIHATGATFALSVEGLRGLLISPSRGLLIFSPVVLVAAGGVRQAWNDGWRSPLRWCALALVAQYLVYGSYAVWWGGHTYGPRYLLEILPLAVPLAAAALQDVGTFTRFAGTAALGWSVVVAATGAFCYPHDTWNTHPSDVDRDHARLWAITDNQIVRCWRRGLSPQNFALVHRATVRRIAEGND